MNQADDAWPVVLEWLRATARDVEILACDPERGRETLLALQVTTRSPMGAIALRSGGMMIDKGWLRILGAGNERVGDGLREWNASLGGEPLDPPLSKALVVAYDALGGFFAMNGGAWPGEVGSIYYLAPDTFAWEDLDTDYSGLLRMVLSPKLETFYESQRWIGWEAEVRRLGPNEAISVAPPLGFKGLPIGDRSRRAVPARELWGFHHELGRQIADLPDGAEIKMQVRWK